MIKQYRQQGGTPVPLDERNLALLEGLFVFFGKWEKKGRWMDCRGGGGGDITFY